MVRAINSRIPIYKTTYGDGSGDVVHGLFRRIAPKAIPIAKQLGMKAIDVVREKCIGAVGNFARKAFSAIKDRLARLIRRPQATIIIIINMFKRISDSAFDMDAPVLKDEYVRHFQYYSYDAQIPDHRGRIELPFHDTSRYFLPAEAFIEVEGEISRAGNTEYVADVSVGFHYVYDRQKKLESVQKDVDVATIILGLARYSDDYSRSTCPSMMFVKDTSNSPEYQQYEIGQSKHFARYANADVQGMIINVDPDFNLGFRSRRAMLKSYRRVFSCEIPLSISLDSVEMSEKSFSEPDMQLY
ncbi:hypothetical protein CHS0354_029022 [Potamilus streckersoni]|uniref:Uncharacterized protein n=1 Tax=Potamilus streckersoni TaxID=2493646 RepID=A0AAE0SFS8_9BIVA|nr:hypothetical protein CHS0354_029022 [Potamilus streckersoni]